MIRAAPSPFGVHAVAIARGSARRASRRARAVVAASRLGIATRRVVRASALPLARPPAVARVVAVARVIIVVIARVVVVARRALAERASPAAP